MCTFLEPFGTLQAVEYYCICNELQEPICSKLMISCNLHHLCSLEIPSRLGSQVARNNLPVSSYRLVAQEIRCERGAFWRLKYTSDRHKKSYPWNFLKIIGNNQVN